MTFTEHVGEKWWKATGKKVEVELCLCQWGFWGWVVGFMVMNKSEGKRQFVIRHFGCKADSNGDVIGLEGLADA